MPGEATRASELEGRTWFKSTYSDEQNLCVEVSLNGDPVLVRDSKYCGPQEGQPLLAISHETWRRFVIAAARDGSSRTVTTSGLSAQPMEYGLKLSAPDSKVTLQFTVQEWDAFQAGAADGQFTVYV